MARYSFKRLGANKFEMMVQALIEKDRRNHGELIQFGAGPDSAELPPFKDEDWQ